MAFVLAFCVVHFVAHLVLMANRYFEFRSTNVKTAAAPQPSDDNIQIMQVEDPGEGSKGSGINKNLRYGPIQVIEWATFLECACLA